MSDRPPTKPPPPQDPLEAMAIRIEKKLDSVIDDVRALTGIARDCFDQLLKQAVEVRDLESRMEMAEARLKLLEHPAEGNGSAA